MIGQWTGCPYEQADTFITIGLSQNPLPLPGGKLVRMELMMGRELDSADLQHLVALLQVVAEDCHSSGQALAPRQVIGPRGPLLEGSKLEAFYCAPPVYWPDEIHGWEATEPETVLCWLIPITASEAAFIRSAGAERFENLLEQKDPPLLDWKREAIV